MRFNIFLGVFFFLGPLCQAWAASFPLPTAGDQIIGQVQHVEAQTNDNFSRLGRRYDVGYYELVEANPHLDPNHLPEGTEVVLPTRFILPAAPYSGIVINVAELRLYYYPPNTHTVVTMPVGIGSEGWNTPVGLTKITAKIKDPTWVVPKSIHDDRAKDGVELPKSIAPGPENPMGFYALYLGIPGYRIHGSKQSDIQGIGRRSSHGCIRLFPEDIEDLFSLVSKGTAVKIINEPMKVGWLHDKLYLESHAPLDDQSSTSTPMATLVTAATAHRTVHIDWAKARHVAERQSGIPRVISKTISREQPQE